MAIATGLTSGGIRTDYMNLLVAQLRNQNPLDPMDNSDMAMQLSQFSQLEQLENLSSMFQKVLMATERSQASSLIGNQVSFSPAGPDGSTTGQVNSVIIFDNVNGQENDDLFSLSTVPRISE